MDTQIGTEIEVSKRSDIEFEAGALASRHGISVVKAREIIDHCGNDVNCIDEHARKAKLEI